MHIPDGFLSGGLNIGTAVISLSVEALAITKAKKTLGEKQIPLLGIMAAFVFAAQMLNFPIGGGTSGHFLGAMLIALLLGPLNAVLVMSVVLIIQCFLFSDGGLTALGSNIFNMGIAAGVGGYIMFKTAQIILPKKRTGFLFAAAAGSWFSVVLASACCAIELAISGTSPFHIVFPAMIGIHSLIGIGEAIITTGVVSILLAARPDLILLYKQK
ncbi:MAG: energy-coupling factor ABC transporter permease [Spirochaetota bacterium]